MQTIKSADGEHILQRFDSLADFVSYSRGLEDHRSASIAMHGDDEFYGSGKYAITCMDDIHDLADKGMAAEGIDALKLSAESVKTIIRDMNEQAFTTFYDVAGADVDVPMFLAGEHECMMDYRFSEVANRTPIATIVLNAAVNCGITAESFIKHGRALVAVAEAIDAAGLQSEIWADFTIRANRATKSSCHRKTGRFAIKLKSGDGPFDAGSLMLTLTHPGFFRACIINAMHAWPKKLHDQFAIGGFYGRAVPSFVRPEDYPDDAVYIPALTANHQAGRFVTSTLMELGLM